MSSKQSARAGSLRTSAIARLCSRSIGRGLSSAALAACSKSSASMMLDEDWSFWSLDEVGELVPNGFLAKGFLDFLVPLRQLGHPGPEAGKLLGPHLEESDSHHQRGDTTAGLLASKAGTRLARHIA